MKKITFIRHSKLIEPYNDYSKLTFEQICDLATGKINPAPCSQTQELIIEKVDNEELRKAELIICSESKRSIETAKIIIRTRGEKIPIKISKNLNEIFFDPAVLTTKNDFNKHGLKIIRQLLFSGMRKNIGAESLKFTLKRIKTLKKTLELIPCNNILCISHSFYMRMLRIFFLENLTNNYEITENQFSAAIDHKYLEGFKIYL